MGPRPIRRGNGKCSSLMPQGGIASMGPRPIRRGNSPPPVFDDYIITASMGPRPIRRGNPWGEFDQPENLIRFNGATSNQTWKQRAFNFNRVKQLLLQWGHVQSDVETAAIWAPVRVGDSASMGPRPIRRGNLPACRIPCSLGRLQWGHVQSDVETEGGVVKREV